MPKREMEGDGPWMSEEFDGETEHEKSERLYRQLAVEQLAVEEIEAELVEHPIDEESEGEPEQAKLKRELKAEALARLEDAARTPQDFRKVVQWWNRLDRNRERRERKYELLRSGDDVPLEYGASANDLCFPDTLNNVIERQVRAGDFLDAIYYCPYEIDGLVTEEYLSEILSGLKEEHKELLFQYAVRQYSSTRIAAIRGQTDRNIRKIRNTMLKKIRKKLLAALAEKSEKQQDLTLLEKCFLEDNGITVDSD